MSRIIEPEITLYGRGFIGRVIMTFRADTPMVKIAEILARKKLMLAWRENYLVIRPMESPKCVMR